MKKVIIYVIPLLLIFSLSCSKHDSIILSPVDSYELGKKGGKENPVEYEVRFTIPDPLPDGVTDASACLKTIDPYFGDADSKFFSVFFHGQFRRYDAVMVEPVDHQGGTYEPLGDPLYYDPNLIVTTNNNNEITSIRLYIKSGSKEDGGIMHKTDQIIFETPKPVSLIEEFKLPIEGWFTIYEYSSFKGGKKGDRVGEIYINEIVYSVP